MRSELANERAQRSVWGSSAFGNMLVSDAYWLYGNPGAPGAFSYQGATGGEDVDYWMSLPSVGWTEIGHPFLYGVDWRPTPPVSISTLPEEMTAVLLESRGKT